MLRKMPTIETDILLYEPNIIYEKCHFSPQDRSPPLAAEFWFANLDPSQRIYVRLQNARRNSLLSNSESLATYEDDLLAKCLVDVQHVISTIQPLLKQHLQTQDVSVRHRFGYLLKHGRLSEIPIPPPCISFNAITSPPKIRRVKLSDIKVLETREIRKNVQIAKLDDRKCLLKTVRYQDEAVAMSFEITNYKRLMVKGLQEYIPELVAMVYVMDEDMELPLSPVSPESPTTTKHFPPVFEDEQVPQPNNEEQQEIMFEVEDNPNSNIHYIGALFQYFPQRDLTGHYTSASLSTKQTWLHQLVTAVAALEAADFKHWDLKCENIVLDTSMIITHDASGRRLSNVRPTEGSPGRIKIIDLENSKATDAFQPESMDVDMTYALGKTVLELFLGKEPPMGDVKEEILASLPEDARFVVRACCNDRNLTVGEIRDALVDKMAVPH